ncbi:MAG TPA: methyltransferase, partial [Microthrixaceae bacterium]|nr:methyltransferase [Microthrixaceae bacterium]
WLGGREVNRALDLCTGSGILAITLARELPGLTRLATDVSAAAAGVASRNVARHQLAARVEVRVGDLRAPVDGAAPFDLIVANPPYIRQGELAGLDREVQREPRLALDGGDDGLTFYRRIAAGLAAHLVRVDGLDDTAASCVAGRLIGGSASTELLGQLLLRAGGREEAKTSLAATIENAAQSCA